MRKISWVLCIFFSLALLCGYVNANQVTGPGSKMMLARRTIAGIIEQNRRNLSTLSLGMTKEKVLNIMENRPLIAYQNGEKISVTSPQKEEILEGKDKRLDVLYYMTEVYGKDYTVTNDKLTPLVFEGNKLIGIGWSFLEEIMKKYGIEKK